MAEKKYLDDAGLSRVVENIQGRYATTFVGTTAQWEALTAEQKAQYTLVNLTDDLVDMDEINKKVNKLSGTVVDPSSVSHNTVAVNSIGYDADNGQLILKTGGADTVVPFSHGGGTVGALGWVYCTGDYSNFHVVEVAANGQVNRIYVPHSGGAYNGQWKTIEEWNQITGEDTPSILGITHIQGYLAQGFPMRFEDGTDWCGISYTYPGGGLNYVDLSLDESTTITASYGGSESPGVMPTKSYDDYSGGIAIRLLEPMT